MTGASSPLLAHAARRLLALRGRDGLWGAFLMTPGQSREWVGALAALALADAAPGLPPALAVRARAAADGAGQALLARIGPSGGWGYNAAAVVDSDSTAAVVRLLVARGLRVPKAAVDLLLAHQREGGFATYLPLAFGDAWARPVTEVTCAVALALVAAGRWDRARLAAVWQDDVAGQQRADGSWPAYWWPHPGVATAMALEFWQAAGRPDPQPARLAVHPSSGFDALQLAIGAIFAGDATTADRVSAALALSAERGADAELLAPPRFAVQPRGEASPEGQGVMTAIATLRLLTLAQRLPTPTPTPTTPRRQRPPGPGIALPLGDLARASGLSDAAAALVTAAAAPLLAGPMGAGVPWPNRPLSSLAIGWPLEVSVRLGPDPRPGFRFTCETGDVRLPPALRLRSGLRALGRAAAHLNLSQQWAQIRDALAPLLVQAAHIDPATRFLVWAGLDVTDTAAGPRAVLKVYANLATAGDALRGLPLAAAILHRLGPSATTGLTSFAASLGPQAFAQQIGLAAVDGGAVQAKLYWELPGYDPDATHRAALDLGLPGGRLDPVIPGLLGRGDTDRHASALAVRIDPQTGLRPEVTLATQASQAVRWRPAYEAARMADWAASLGFDGGALVRLRASLGAVPGAAPRSLHTLTLDPRGLTAAVYLRPESWIAARLAPTGGARGPADTPSPLASLRHAS